MLWISIRIYEFIEKYRAFSLFYYFNTNPRFPPPPFLLYIRCKNGSFCMDCMLVIVFAGIDRFYLSRVMRKTAFCICENKRADQLCCNRTADQRVCFRYIFNSTIPLLSKSEISSQSRHLLWLYRPVCFEPGRKPRRPVLS